ncbi:MAG: glycosyltransferase family 2 protein [Methylococcaceae bacterium]|nr:glycosyltransferase family 2 protein [Methylococcaceae bacterium]
MFSILIPSWNNLAFLKTCVDSLQKNSRYRHQIIIHLNEGNDGSLEWVDQLNLDYSQSETNIGICYAMNVARTLATTDYLVYFNDDMYACPDWDYWLYEEIKKQESIFFFLSATMIEPRDTGNLCVIAAHDFGSHPNNFDEKALLEQFNLTEKSDWQGSTWPPCVVPKLLWDMVGGYSIEFSPGMYSDPDFVMKLWQVGVRNFKGVGKSRVYHFMSKSTGKLLFKANVPRAFLNKWGISAKVFARFYLRRGTTWNGKLTLPIQTGLLKCHMVINQLKRRLS